MRVLTENLETAVSGGKRRPAYKVYSYDPSLDSMSTIAQGKASQVPYDLTPYVEDISWSPGKFSFTLADPDGLFYPDYGTERDRLADGAILRLREGDEAVPESEWPWTHTGTIRGQVGWEKSRRSQTLQTKVSVFSRENNQAFKRRKITSKNYTVGTEIGVMLMDIASVFMDITQAESRLPAVLGLQLRHQVNQISMMAPWEAVTVLLETVARMPYFDGEGKLTCINKNMNRPPDRILPDYVRIIDYQVPERSQDGINKVKVIFLDSDLERVDSPYQKLGQAQVTTGFFSLHETLPCWWSEDHKQRARETSMVVIKSVNSGILPVGTESYQEVDEFHGQIDVAISVWVPILASVMLATYLAAAWIPDKTVGAVSTGGGVGT